MKSEDAELYNRDNILNVVTDLSEVAHRCDNSRNLMHAYIACLDIRDLCHVIHISLEASTIVRRALRSRLVRIIKTGIDHKSVHLIVDLVERNYQFSLSNRKIRMASDAILSSLFTFLPLDTQHLFLERWLDRGDKDAMARWMKAAMNSNLFDANVALSYWKISGDQHAAKLLAYEADPQLLREIIPDFIRRRAEGWIIARAVIRVGLDDENHWEQIAEQHPATYLYLCAQMNRFVTDQNAIDLIFRCLGPALGGDRGLAIWAVGQMGMVGVLDEIKASLEELKERDYAAFRLHQAAR